jgi:predicted RNase H-like HicB family nuclease
MDIEFNVEIVKKGKWYIARIPELDFVTQGETADEARKNIIELVEIQFEETAINRVYYSRKIEKKIILKRFFSVNRPPAARGPSARGAYMLRKPFALVFIRFRVRARHHWELLFF